MYTSDFDGLKATEIRTIEVGSSSKAALLGGGGGDETAVDEDDCTAKSETEKTPRRGPWYPKLDPGSPYEYRNVTAGPPSAYCVK